MMNDEALFWESFLSRTLPLISPEGADILRKTTIAIPGLGGVGGVAAVILTRLGVGSLHISDPNVFDAPDLNRQYAATTNTLGQNKASVYEKLLKEINPYLKIKNFTGGIHQNNILDFLEGADLLIDGLDLSVPADIRMALFDEAYRKGLYALTSPLLAFGTLIACSDPKGKIPLSDLFKLIESGRSSASFPPFFYRIYNRAHLNVLSTWLKEKKTKVPTIAIAPLLSASLVCTETLNALIGHVMPGGRKPLCLPKVRFIDIHEAHLLDYNVGWIMALKKYGDQIRTCLKRREQC